jgi:hypothetical protein
MTYNNSKMLLERAQKVLPQSFRWWHLQALASARSLRISDDLIKCAALYPDKSGDVIAWRQSLTVKWRHDPTIRTARLLSIIGGPGNYASLAQVLRDTNRRWDLRIECFKTLVALGAPGYSRNGLTRFRRNAKMSKDRKRARIRSAFIKAAKSLQKRLQLKGRGHVARCSLNPETARAVSGLKLPCTSVSVSRSYRTAYPKALVANAAKILRIPIDSLLGTLPERSRRRRKYTRRVRFDHLPPLMVVNANHDVM